MTTSETAPPGRRTVIRACVGAGLDPAGAEPVRIAENEIWRLPGQGVIVRVTRSDQLAASEREIHVARWLQRHGVPAVRALEVAQPVVAEGRPVTFWEEVHGITHGSPADVARLLRGLHCLQPPDDLGLGELDPFVRIPQRLAAATVLSEDDRQWIHALHNELAAEWAELAPTLDRRAVHGDAWPGNLVRTSRGPLMMDFERFSYGPPEWDLVSTAVRRRTTGAMTAAEYEEFCTEYGRDVTIWPGYPVLARARELRMTTYAAQHAARNPEWREQAQYRVDCLRGRHGARPWSWRGIL